jgi:PhnB protein
MLQPIPYLAFNGQCADAMRFYKRILGGKLGMMSNRNSPFASQCPPEHLDRMMHARLDLDDGMSIYAADCPPQMGYQGMHGFSLTLNYETVEQAEKVFNALADGGRVAMPFGDTFWAKKFGMVTDKFGCHWIVNGALVDMPLVVE